MPFVILICVGVILVLLFNLWGAIFDEEPDRGVTFNVIEGSVQMKTWGNDQYVDLPSGSVLMEGDELQTSKEAKVVVEFNDGTILRIDGETDFILDEMNFDLDMPVIRIMLMDGQLWFNKLFKNVNTTNLEIVMGDVVVKSFEANVIDVENNDDEIVRVVNGASVDVDIMSENGEKIVETVKIGVGQEVVFSQETLQKYWEYLSPNVLAALSDEFRLTQWYLWNVAQDRAPATVSVTDSDGFSPVNPEDVDEIEIDNDGNPVNLEENVTEAESEKPVLEEETAPDKEVVEEVSSTLSKPTISSVAGMTAANEFGLYPVTSNLATLVGTAPGASAVYVNDYKLQKFTAGAATWTYFANADYNLMVAGENVYNIYSVDAKGKKSETLSIKVFYTPAKVEEVVVEEVVEEEVVEEEVEPVVPDSKPEWLTQAS